MGRLEPDFRSGINIRFMGKISKFRHTTINWFHSKRSLAVRFRTTSYIILVSSFFSSNLRERTHALGTLEVCFYSAGRVRFVFLSYPQSFRISLLAELEVFDHEVLDPAILESSLEVTRFLHARFPRFPVYNSYRK